MAVETGIIMTGAIIAPTLAGAAASWVTTEKVYNAAKDLMHSLSESLIDEYAQNGTPLQCILAGVSTFAINALITAVSIVAICCLEASLFSLQVVLIFGAFSFGIASSLNTIYQVVTDLWREPPKPVLGEVLAYY